MSIKIYLGTDTLDGEQVIAIRTVDGNFVVASNDDGDSREMVVSWLQAHANIRWVHFAERTWPKRDANEVKGLDLVMEIPE